MRALVSAVAGPLLLGYLLVATVIALVTAWVPGARFSMAGAFAAACPAWLVAQHVPISIHGAPLGVLPLLPTGLLMALVARAANRAAYRLGCHSAAEARFLVLLIGGSHLVVGVLLAVLVSRAGLDVEAPAAAIGCGLVSATAATVGLIRPCGLFPMLFGALVRPVAGARGTSVPQPGWGAGELGTESGWGSGVVGTESGCGSGELGAESGWGSDAVGPEFGGGAPELGPVRDAADLGADQVPGAPVGLGASVPLGVRAGLIGLLTLLAGGLALIVVGLGLNFGAATSMFGRTAPGVAGGLGLVLLCVGYLPNAAVAATSLLAGPGFSVGMTNVTMTGLRTGPVPDVPLLAALPSRFALWWPVGFLLPLLAGLLVGWWVRRIDELPQARLRAVGVAAGVAAVGCFVLAEVAGGRLGSGAVDPVELPAGLFAVAVFCWIAVPGSAVAWLAGPRPHRLPAPTDITDAADPHPDDDPTAESADHQAATDTTEQAEQADVDQPEHPDDEHPDHADPVDHADDYDLDDEYDTDYSDEAYRDDDPASEYADPSHETDPNTDHPSQPDESVEPRAKPTPSAESTTVSADEYRDDEYRDDYDADFDPDALLDLDPDADIPGEPHRPTAPDRPRTFSAHRAPHPDQPRSPDTTDDHPTG